MLTFDTRIDTLDSEGVSYMHQESHSTDSAKNDKSDTTRKLKPREETQSKMTPLAKADFEKLLHRASQPTSQKHSSKRR